MATPIAYPAGPPVVNQTNPYNQIDRPHGTVREYDYGYNPKPTFYDQVSHAKRLSRARNPLERNFLHQSYRARDWQNQGSGGLYGAIKRNDGRSVVRLGRTNAFNSVMDRAYNSPSGYAIGYVKGQKVMAVSGSRNTADWAYNAYEVKNDTFLPNYLTIPKLNEIAKRNNVKVVIGHSRGARLVSGMKGPFQKAGFDGAMLLADWKDKKMLNIVQSRKYPRLPWQKRTRNFVQPLDRIIGATGRNNYYTPYSGKQPHFFYKDYPGYNEKSFQYDSGYKQALPMSNIWRSKKQPWYQRRSWY